MLKHCLLSVQKDQFHVCSLFLFLQRVYRSHISKLLMLGPEVPYYSGPTVPNEKCKVKIGR